MVSVQFFKLLTVLPTVRSLHGARRLIHSFKGISTLFMTNMSGRPKLQKWLWKWEAFDGIKCKGLAIKAPRVLKTWIHCASLGLWNNSCSHRHWLPGHLFQKGDRCTLMLLQTLLNLLNQMNMKFDYKCLHLANWPRCKQQTARWQKSVRVPK